MTITVYWKKLPNRTFYGWVCTYGNIVAQSKISPRKCAFNLLKQLKKRDVDTTNIKFRKDKESVKLYRKYNHERDNAA